MDVCSAWLFSHAEQAGAAATAGERKLVDALRVRLGISKAEAHKRGRTTKAAKNKKIRKGMEEGDLNADQANDLASADIDEAERDRLTDEASRESANRSASSNGRCTVSGHDDRSMPWAQIARRVDRHRTTISREVERNGGRDLYRPAIACQRALTARCRARACRLTQGGELRDRVTAELKLSRSPVAIWADLAADGIEDRPCVETIYAAVYGGVLGKLAPQWPSPLA
jgi:hypothetical protein